MKTFWYWFFVIFLMMFAIFCFDIAFPELDTRRSIALYVGVESVVAFIYLIFKDIVTDAKDK